MPEFAQFRDSAAGFIPASYVDVAETLFGELCRTQLNVRLLRRPFERDGDELVLEARKR